MNDQPLPLNTTRRLATWSEISLPCRSPRCHKLRSSLACLLLFLPFPALAAGEQDPVSSVILWVTIIFSFAVLGRYLAYRFKQPAVLGELLMGVLVGNLCYFLGSELFLVLRNTGTVFAVMHDLLNNLSLTQAVNDASINPEEAKQLARALSNSNGMDYVKIAYVLDVFSRYGVIFLLFMVGLESSFQELKHTGRESIQVAFLGVIAPVLLGYVTAKFLLPDSNYQTHLFVAATLAATSVGITARVLSELKKLTTREARTILGAAMIDDILGLILLAIVSSLIIKQQVSFLEITQLTISAPLFFILTLLLGPWVLKQAVRAFSFLADWETKLFVSFIFVMSLSWLATVFQLASIIGAFAAGLVIHDGFFEGQYSKSQMQIKHLFSPLESILAPLFFMLIGIQVKLESFANMRVLFIAIVLTLVAIIGKLVSGLGANKKDDRLLVGLGMLPRGEVGLIFASIGCSLGVISDELFSAIVFMVMTTTILAPPLLKRRYARAEYEN